MRQQLRHLCCFGYYYSINDIHSPIVNDQTNDTDEISAEYVILEHEGKRAGLEADDQKVHEIVVLDAFVLPRKKTTAMLKPAKASILKFTLSPNTLNNIRTSTTKWQACLTRVLKCR